jgi:NAD(P)-dependent dehydrogenase (short-subunit alcohol dehydrogenase family)
MTQGMPPDRLAMQAAKNVSGRLILPEDVARVVCFLASDEAAMISGAIWDVGGIQGQMSM